MPEFILVWPDKVSVHYSVNRSLTLRIVTDANGQHSLHVSGDDVLLIQPCAWNAIDILLPEKPPVKK